MIARMAPALTERASQQPLHQQLPYAPPLLAATTITTPTAQRPFGANHDEKKQCESISQLGDKGLLKAVQLFQSGLGARLLNGFSHKTTASLALPPTSSTPFNGQQAAGASPQLGRSLSTTMNGGKRASDTQQQHSHAAENSGGNGKRSSNSGRMGLSKVNATSLLGNGDGACGLVAAQVKRPDCDDDDENFATPVVVGITRHQSSFCGSGIITATNMTSVSAPVTPSAVVANAAAVRDVHAQRERFQANLERRTERMLRRVRKLQATQAARHVSAQLSSLVGQHRQSLQLTTTDSSSNNRSLIHATTGAALGRAASDSGVPHSYLPIINTTNLQQHRPHSSDSTSASSPCSSSSASSSSAASAQHSDLNRGGGVSVGASGAGGLLPVDNTKGMTASALLSLARNMGSSGVGSSVAGPPASNLRRPSVQPGALNVANCMYGVRVAPNTSTAGQSSLQQHQQQQHGQLNPRLCDELRWTSGNLLSNLSLLEREVDSEATASSSGGESCDERETEPPPPREVGDKRPKTLPFYKRASWKWAAERAGVVSRWTWLQAQVSDLEYRIRQTADIYKQIRAIKEPVVDYHARKPSPAPAPSPQVNGYISTAGSTVTIRPPANTNATTATDNAASGSVDGGAVPPMTSLTTDAASAGGDASDEDGCTSSRTCPLRPLRKRKLLRTSGLHQNSNRKAARLSTVRCTCQCPTRMCNTCCARHNHVQPVDVERMSTNDRMALLDPSFHPVLSFPQDASLSLYFEALIRSGEYNKLGAKAKISASIKKKARSASQISDHARKQCRKLKKNATATLTARLRKRLSKEKRMPANQRRQALRKKKLAANRLANPAAGLDRTISESSACSSKRDSPVPSPGFQENSSSQASGNSSWGSSEPKEQQARKSGGGSGGILQDILRRRRVVGSAFDINNIVIPYSMAAATRVERLHYKEIITPKWRLADEVVPDPPADDCSEAELALLDDEEDVTDDMCVRRHDRCEVDERKRFMGYQLNRQLNRQPVSRRTRSATRSDSRADSSGANTPDPMSPHDHHQPSSSQHHHHHHHHQDSPTVSPPPTPVAGGGEEQSLLAHTPTILQQISRRRTTSLSRRDNRSVDDRVPSPDDTDVEHVDVAPWELRVFPLDENEFEAFEREVKALADEPVAPRLRRHCSGSGSEMADDPGEDDDDDDEIPITPAVDWDEPEPTLAPSDGDPDWIPDVSALVMDAEEDQAMDLDEVETPPP